MGPNKDSNDRLNDYLIGLEKFSEVADYITINISSPNTENLRNFHEENKLKELLKSVSEKKKQLKTKIPIAIGILVFNCFFFSETDFNNSFNLFSS